MLGGLVDAQALQQAKVLVERAAKEARGGRVGKEQSAAPIDGADPVLDRAEQRLQLFSLLVDLRLKLARRLPQSLQGLIEQKSVMLRFRADLTDADKQSRPGGFIGQLICVVDAQSLKQSAQSGMNRHR